MSLFKGLGSPPENRSASAYLPDAYPFLSSNTSILPIEKIKLRILVAEDNPLNAKILKLQLIKMGHEVIVVSDGQACFDRFRQDHRSFDVILMDFQVSNIF
jgi:PleD family two-component response regulator